MKKFLILSMLLGALIVTPVGLKVIVDETATMPQPQKAALQYGGQRPYSFYYPYNYQYYTPHRTANSMACHWVYVNGTYIYRCD